MSKTPAFETVIPDEVPGTKAVAAAILAGGKSSRMGQAKALLRYQDKSLLEHLASRLKQDVQRLFVVGCPEAGLYEGLSIPVVIDDMNDIGPLGGIDTALRYIADKNVLNKNRPGTKLANKNQLDKTSAIRYPIISYLLVLPCDGIQLPRVFLSRMVQVLERRNADLVFAKDALREQHLYCLIKTELHASLQDYIAQGGRKVIDWFHLHHYAVVDFSEDGFTFSNLNTPDDWQTFLTTQT